MGPQIFFFAIQNIISVVVFEINQGMVGIGAVVVEGLVAENGNKGETNLTRLVLSIAVANCIDIDNYISFLCSV